MLRLTDILNEVKSKPALINLFKNNDILDNGKLKKLLIHYIESPSLLSQTEFENLVNGLNKVKSKYADVLQPKSGWAYRGTAITPEIYKKIKTGDTTTSGGYTIIKAPYKSNRNVQSWTYDKNVADRFATKGMFNNPTLEQGGKPAIVRTKIDDSFVGNPNLTGPISNRLSIKNEKEIFHIGQTVENCEWMIATNDIQKLK